MSNEPQKAASLLLDRYGSLAQLFHLYRRNEQMQGAASSEVNEHLGMIAETFAQALKAEAFDGLRLHSPAALIRYLQGDMALLQRETFRVLFLDGQNTLIADRVMWTGTVDRVQVHPRELLLETLSLGATALILAHNHPSGTASPSEEDIAITGRLMRACLPFDIVIHDHLIISRASAHSMRGSGLIDRLARAQRASDASVDKVTA